MLVNGKSLIRVVKMCYSDLIDMSCDSNEKNMRVKNVAQTLDFELIFLYTRVTIRVCCVYYNPLSMIIYNCQMILLI